MVELINIDCMEAMALMKDKAFDLAIVDPPYGRGEDGGTNRSKGVKQKNGTILMCVDGGYAKKDWDKEPPPLEYFTELIRVTKHQIIWGINYHPVMMQGGRIIWDKVNDGSDQSGAEIAYCSMNNRVDIFRFMWRGMMQGQSIIDGTRQQGNKKLNEQRIHPTQKPVALYQWLLKNYAKSGDKILDTHGGSFSSALACDIMGFDYVGYEIDKDYYEAALDRFNRHKQQTVIEFKKEAQ